MGCERMIPLLKVEDLRIDFVSQKISYPIVDQLSFQVLPGEILAVVGESGSGKSISLLSLMGLLGSELKTTGGRAFFQEEDLFQKTEKELDQIRGKEISMVFQDALTSLNPVFTVGNQMIEGMKIHMGLSKQQAKERALLLLEKVGLPDPSSVFKKYPHTLSGGMRQRVMIAMALSCKPELLIADEPTTALDVTIQAQIIQLLKELREELNMAIILITHDMGLVAELADRVLVLYAGQIVEEAKVEDLFAKPSHPYTMGLLTSIPQIQTKIQKKQEPLQSIEGNVPDTFHDIEGCRFQNRCPYKTSGCEKQQQLHQAQTNHWSRCFRYDFIQKEASL